MQFNVEIANIYSTPQTMIKFMIDQIRISPNYLKPSSHRGIRCVPVEKFPGGSRHSLITEIKRKLRDVSVI